MSSLYTSTSPTTTKNSVNKNLSTSSLFDFSKTTIVVPYQYLKEFEPKARLTSILLTVNMDVFYQC